MIDSFCERVRRDLKEELVLYTDSLLAGSGTEVGDARLRGTRYGLLKALEILQDQENRARREQD
jgi:hypothetical protein